MTYDFQLDTWLKGVPLHDEERCVPDFSCCNMRLLAPFEERVLFVESYNNGKFNICHGMLLIFTQRAYPNLDIGGFYNA
jgi:hypothetical protein